MKSEIQNNPLWKVVLKNIIVYGLTTLIMGTGCFLLFEYFKVQKIFGYEGQLGITWLGWTILMFIMVISNPIASFLHKKLKSLNKG